MASSGACTITEERVGSMKKVKWEWSTSSGLAPAASRVTTHTYNGKVQRLVTIPDSGSAPSANYDVYIMDQDSVDILIAGGANRHSANTEQVLAVSLGVIANDTMTLNVGSTSSSATAGVVIVYIR
jgi:hypothetical protein